MSEDQKMNKGDLMDCEMRLSSFMIYVAFLVILGCSQSTRSIDAGGGDTSAAKIAKRLLVFLDSPDSVMREKTLRDAAKMAGLSPSCTTQLIEILRSDHAGSVREAAWRFLIDAGIKKDAAVIPVLIRLIKLKDDVEGGGAFICWEDAVKQLGRFGLKAEVGAPILRHILAKPSCCYGWMRPAAASALHRIMPESDVPVKCMTQLMQSSPDRNDLQRISECLSDGSMIAALWRRIMDTVPGRRAIVMRVLRDAGKPAVCFVPEIREALKDSDEPVRIAAAGALHALDNADSGGEMIRLLVKSLDSVCAPEAISELRSASERIGYVLPELLQAVAHNNASVRAAAVRQISIGSFPLSEDMKAMSILDRAIADDSEEVRREAVNWCNRHRSDHSAVPASLAIPLLRRALRDKSVSVFMAALNALERRNSEAAPAVAEMIECLNHERASVRAQACRILGYIGIAAKRAVPALRKAMKDEDANVRKDAVSALRRIDSEAP